MKISYNLLSVLLVLFALASCNPREGADPISIEAAVVSSTQKPTSAETPSIPPTKTSTPAVEPITGIEITASKSAAEVYCASEIEDARDSYNRALAFQMEGSVEEAIDLYLEAIELDPTYCDAMDNLGLILRGMGNLDEAISWYSQSIEIHPSGIAAHQNLASAYFHKGDFDNALNTYMILVEIDAENPEGYFGMGNVYLALNDPTSAISHLELAEEIYEEMSSPYLSHSHYLLGVAHYLTENCGFAVEYFELISDEFESHAYFNAYLGTCYLDPSIENIELARVHLLKAQSLGLQIPDETLEEIN